MRWLTSEKKCDCVKEKVEASAAGSLACAQEGGCCLVQREVPSQLCLSV